MVSSVQSYTRFTGRVLVLWLLALPFALWPLMGWSCALATFVTSYVIIGIDECGIEIEEPFAILPLQALCEAIRRDVTVAEKEAAKGAERWPGTYRPGFSPSAYTTSGDGARDAAPSLQEISQLLK